MADEVEARRRAREAWTDIVGRGMLGVREGEIGAESPIRVKGQ